MGSAQKPPKESLMSRYRLHEVIGQGRFGIVRRATLVATGEQVAMKLVPKKEGKQQPDALHEGEMMKAVFHHPHIVNLREAFDDDHDGHSVIVMDLASGGELFHRVVANGAYSEADASELMRYIMSAVSHCHSRGVVHRDLKPENIMLASKDGAELDVRLCDFGLAARVVEGECTLKGKVGTVGNTAPDMLGKEGAPPPLYGSKVDDWALGVILYILLGGFHPFDPDCNADDETITQRIVRGQWSFSGESWAGISAEARSLVAQLLESDPEKRLTASEALNHPWIRGDAQPSKKPLHKSSARLGEFNDAREKWRAATKATINREGLATQDRRSSLAAAFNLIDTDGNGQISRAELAHFLKRLETKASPSEIDRMLRHADVDGNGEISLDEFVAMNL